MRTQFAKTATAEAFIANMQADQETCAAELKEVQKSKNGNSL